MSSERAFPLVRAYGRESVSFQALGSDCRYWFADAACVAYVESGGAWVAIGSPLTAPGRSEEVARSFARAARRAGRRARFFATEHTWGEDTRFHALQIGEQPVWQPASWPRGLAPKLQRQMRQHERQARVQTSCLDARELLSRTVTRRKLEQLQERWLSTRKMAPMGFLLRTDLTRHAPERRYFVAEHDGRLAGAIIAMPVYARNGWLLETCLRYPAAPSGTMELLFDLALRTLRGEGSEHVSFGLCPLAGTSSGWQRAIRHCARALYDFDGLRHFKGKLGPSYWQPVYLSFPREDPPPLALFDVLGAFCPDGMLAFGVRTVLRRARSSWPAANVGPTPRADAGTSSLTSLSSIDGHAL